MEQIPAHWKQCRLCIFSVFYGKQANLSSTKESFELARNGVISTIPAIHYHDA